jgi:predicted nuclease with TOPRIM domain
LLLQQREKFDSVLILEKERYQKVRAENSRLNEDIERVNSKLFSMIRENEDLQKEVRHCECFKQSLELQSAKSVGYRSNETI